MINLKRNGKNPSNCTHVHPQTASLLVTNPFGQTAMAYCNGSFISTPLRPIPVIKRRPRTEFINLTAMYSDATQGF